MFLLIPLCIARTPAPLTSRKRGCLPAIAAQAHAAPPPGPFFADVKKMQHTLITLAHPVAVLMREQLRHRMRYGCKQVFGLPRFEKNLRSE